MIRVYGEGRLNNFKNEKIFSKMILKKGIPKEGRLEFSLESIEFEDTTNPLDDEHNLTQSSWDSPLKTLMPKISTYRPPKKHGLSDIIKRKFVTKV